MGGEHDARALRYLDGLVDEDSTAFGQGVDDMPVVHDLLAHIDRGAIVFDGAFDGDHRAIDSCAVAARRGQQNSLPGPVRDPDLIRSPALARNHRGGNGNGGHLPSLSRGRGQRPGAEKWAASVPFVRLGIGRGHIMAQRISGTPGTLGESVEPKELAATAAETTAENPWPLSLLSSKMKSYIDRMSSVWIEGQVVELNHRGKASYLTLRDSDVELSLPVQLWRNVLERTGAPLPEGSHVVANLNADLRATTGRLPRRAHDIRAVGQGELPARPGRRKTQWAAEGLFDLGRKLRLPFLPNRIGLITGRDSDAQKDVVRNVHLRWPAAQFEIRNCAVQGPDAVPDVMRNLAELDEDPQIDLIVIARGGGSMEDLLPFSNEALVRAVSDARTPVVSAIGHEADRPILDEVADMRASTPTAAAKRI